MNSRQIQLVQDLIKQEYYQTTSVLAKKLAVSERTLQKDLSTINALIEKQRNSLVLERKKGIGILLKGDSLDKEKLLEQLMEVAQTPPDNQQLQELIVFHILQNPNDKISLDELAEQLFVNRKLIQEEIRKLKPYFAYHRLELMTKPGYGTYVLGEEDQKRRLLIQTLKKMKKSDLKNPSLKEFFKQDRLKVVRDTLLEVLEANQISVDSDLSNIDYHIYFMLERMKSSKEVELSLSEVEAVENSQAQAISSQVLAQLAMIYPIQFSPSEINYLALRIASSLPSLRPDLQFDQEAAALMDYLIQQVSDILSYPLREDTILKSNLSSHLSSTYFRLNYHLSISNPLTEAVFNAYPQLFLVLQLLLDDYFKQEEHFVPQDEIAYLTIHFQSAIERQKFQKSKTFKVLLVSEYSKAMATFIEARLNRELPELQVVDLVNHKESSGLRKHSGYDFILSTVPLEIEKIPVIQISPMISRDDLMTIEKYMLENSPGEQGQSFDLASFTQPFFIYPQLELDNPEAILRFMGNNLLAHDHVEAQFVNELLSRDRFSSTRVAPFITLPHANPKFVKQSMVSIATLKKPIDWHGEMISIVMMISVTKEVLKSSEFKKLFSVIHYISQNPDCFNKICQTQNVLEILSLLSYYEM